MTLNCHSTFVEAALERSQILMPDERSPIQHALVLRRLDPDQGIARFIDLMRVTPPRHSQNSSHYGMAKLSS
jgi:hypothetical protein